MDDHLPRGSAGDVLAHVPLDRPERQIDASRHAGRGPDRPIGNKDARPSSSPASPKAKAPMQMAAMRLVLSGALRRKATVRGVGGTISADAPSNNVSCESFPMISVSVVLPREFVTFPVSETRRIS